MRFSLSRDLRDLPFTPGDWFILSGILVLLIIGVVWFLSAFTSTFTVEVPAVGGTYSEGIVGTPRFVNPVLAISDADRDMVQLVFSGLLRATSDGTLVPDLASDFTVSDDHRTYTFTLKDTARFHDGTAVTADDVAFTVGLAQNSALKSPKRANWEGVVVTVVDPKTISFTLKEPYAPFLDNMRLGILPKHLWANVAIEEMPFSKLNSEPVGSGPYKVKKLTTTSAGIPSKLTLEAFTDGVRVPYISTLEFTFFADVDALGTAMKTDALLGGHSLTPTDYENHAAHEAVLARIFSVFFNQNQNDLFADKVVRSALNTALDKQAIVSTLIGGYGTVLTGPLPPESISAVESPETTQAEQLAKAQAVLTAAGWTKGADGVFTKTVKKVTKRLAFTLTTGNAPELKGAADLVAATWRELGVDVTVQSFEANDLQQDVIRPRKYDALLFGEVVGRDMDLFAFWDSSQRNDPGLNIALYTNATVDKLLKDARADEDIVERRKTTREAADIITDEVAAVFLYSPHFVYLTPTNVHGLTLGTMITPADRFISIADWYIKTEHVWPFLK